MAPDLGGIDTAAGRPLPAMERVMATPCTYCSHPLKSTDSHLTVNAMEGVSGMFCSTLCFDGARMRGAVVETGLLMADVESSRDWKMIAFETLMPRVSGRCAL
jgi:hypothetical protein